MIAVCRYYIQPDGQGTESGKKTKGEVDVGGIRLWRELVENVDIACYCLRNADKARDTAAQEQGTVAFDRSLALAEKARLSIGQLASSGASSE